MRRPRVKRRVTMRARVGAPETSTRPAMKTVSPVRNRSSEKNCCQISGAWQANLARACLAANRLAAQQGICFRALRHSASLLPAQTLMEVRRVDLRLKLNVLAVCAVFVFVGAILLGAF
jgi:hypothetical protein